MKLDGSFWSHPGLLLLPIKKQKKDDDEEEKKEELKPSSPVVISIPSTPCSQDSPVLEGPLCSFSPVIVGESSIIIEPTTTTMVAPATDAAPPSTGETTQEAAAVPPSMDVVSVSSSCAILSPTKKKSIKRRIDPIFRINKLDGSYWRIDEGDIHAEVEEEEVKEVKEDVKEKESRGVEVIRIPDEPSMQVEVRQRVERGESDMSEVVTIRVTKKRTTTTTTTTMTTTVVDHQQRAQQQHQEDKVTSDIDVLKCADGFWVDSKLDGAYWKISYTPRSRRARDETYVPDWIPKVCMCVFIILTRSIHSNHQNKFNENNLLLLLLNNNSKML